MDKPLTDDGSAPPGLGYFLNPDSSAHIHAVLLRELTALRDRAVAGGVDPGDIQAIFERRTRLLRASVEALVAPLE